MLTLALSARHWGPPLVSHLGLIRLQRRCLDYVPPQPVRVIYDDDPAAIPGLLTSGSHPGFPRSTGTASVSNNPLLDAYHQGTGRLMLPTVFLGRRTSPAGNERLVIVSLSLVPGGGNPFEQFVLRPDVETPRTLFGPREVTLTIPNRVTGLELFVLAADRTRLLEGQPDPADPSHFTIDYTHNGNPGTIDGWLNADDTVTLGPRAGDVLELNPAYRWWSPTPGGLPPLLYPNAPGATRPLGSTGPFDPTTRPVLPKRDDPQYN